MLAQAAAGEPVNRRAGPFKMPEMQAWGKERTVRAAVLRHLLTAGQWPVASKGVWLRGVRVNGLLNLKAEALRCPLSLDRCYLDADDPVCLDYAAASRLIFTRCQMAGLTGEMITAREFDLYASTLTGPLRLTSADIIGRVSCGGAKLNGTDKDGNALHAVSMKVGGGVFLGKVSTAAGAIELRGADITGPLSCGGAKLNGTDKDGNALLADGIKVDGGVFLDQEFKAAGTVRMPGANITGPLVCRGAQLTGTKKNRNALLADWMKVGGGVFLDQEFKAAGTVRMPGAEITGPLACHGAQLTGTDGDGRALHADWIKVHGGVFLDREFTAAGTVSLVAARADASVYLKPKALADENKIALDAARAQISDTLWWAPAAQVSGQVNLEGATAGQLHDHWDSERPNGYWPASGRLRLDGFTYGRFGGGDEVTVDQRLAWIRGQYQCSAKGHWKGFATQPYEQLAAVYRQVGQDSQARKVAIARRADLRKYGNLSLCRKFGNRLLDITISYGYHSWRAAAYLVAVFVAFLLLSILGQCQHVIVPIGDIKDLHPAPSATQCTSNYPCFYPTGYTIDTVIPIINVHQAAYWGPDGHAPWGWVWVGGTWVATGLGWALATLLVAGYTGLVRQD